MPLHDQQPLLAVLEAREQRWNERLRLATRYARPVLSCTLRLPYALRLEYADCLEALFADFIRRVPQCLYMHTHFSADGPEALAVADMDARELKRLALAFEAEPRGAVLDLDVMDADGTPLSRDDWGLPPRDCLVCSGRLGGSAGSVDAARTCVALQRHTVDEVRRRVETLWPVLLVPPVLPVLPAGTEKNSRNVRTVARLARLAMEDEVRTHPKPGLVTPLDTGAHKDMDAALFFRSARAIAPFFAHCVRVGATLDDVPGPTCLQRLRRPGLAAEQAMFRATSGVNTHKGLIFSMGLVCCGAGVVLRRCRQGAPHEPAADVLAIVKALCAELVDELNTDGLDAAASQDTAGKRQFRQYGVTGARGQAASGFAVVAETSLPCLRKALHSGLDWNAARVQTLLALMTVVDDTNVLHRGGPEGMRLLQSLRDGAAEALRLGGLHTAAGQTALAALETLCRERGLSPGGCADLLALTLFLYRFELFIAEIA